MKYIIEADERSELVQVISVMPNGTVYTNERSIDELEELNSDYINEHFGDLKDTAYQRGLEDGKWKAEDGCTGCEWEDTPFDACERCCNNYKNMWQAKQTDNCIEIGDEVEWDGDKYIVTYRNIDINTGVIKDYDLMMWNGSVVDHVKKCSFVKTGNHYDISSILKEMKE